MSHPNPLTDDLRCNLLLHTVQCKAVLKTQFSFTANRCTALVGLKLGCIAQYRD